MPELLEVEGYRRLAELILFRPILAVEAPDAWYLKRGLTATGLRVLVGGGLVVARRRGKLLLLDVATVPDGGRVVLGLRFGMTGRLLVDGTGTNDHQRWRARTRPRYERFRMAFADGGWLSVVDPRRLGGVELDPDESRIGRDAAVVTESELARSLSGSRALLKARLLDQVQLGGIGNLLADEVLWRAGLSPFRTAQSLSPPEVRHLHHHLRSALSDLAGRGGSHTGDLMAERVIGGKCPKDGRDLRRDRVCGRTTWWCPAHQR